VRLFAQDLPASDVAVLTGLTRKTVNSIFGKIRQRLAQACEQESPFTTGEVEVDESYFGARILLWCTSGARQTRTRCQW
jgi:transposase